MAKTISISDETMEKLRELIPRIWLKTKSKQTNDKILNMLISEKLAELEKTEKK